MLDLVVVERWPGFMRQAEAYDLHKQPSSGSLQPCEPLAAADGRTGTGRWPSCNDLRNNLWPWLQEREYAAPEDDEWLDAFLERLDQPTSTCVPESR
jgi:hypothetical protein